MGISIKKWEMEMEMDSVDADANRGGVVAMLTATELARNGPEEEGPVDAIHDSHAACSSLISVHLHRPCLPCLTVDYIYLRTVRTYAGLRTHNTHEMHEMPLSHS